LKEKLLRTIRLEDIVSMVEGNLFLGGPEMRFETQSSIAFNPSSRCRSLHSSWVISCNILML
jgi:hypothetical protein